jgi:hypothetical protein
VSSSSSAAPRWARGCPARQTCGAGSSGSGACCLTPLFEVQHLVVGGPVWDQRIAAHVIIRSRVSGEPYENQFAQFLTLRWGKVVEDFILEDTATWEAASRRLAAAGNIEAAAPPLATKPA